MAAGDKLITDADAMIANGPGATTALNAAGAGAAGVVKIIDYVGTLQLYKTHLEEAQRLATLLDGVTDSGDTTNKADLAAALVKLA